MVIVMLMLRSQAFIPLVSEAAVWSGGLA